MCFQRNSNKHNGIVGGQGFEPPRLHQPSGSRTNPTFSAKVPSTRQSRLVLRNEQLFRTKVTLSDLNSFPEVNGKDSAAMKSTGRLPRIRIQFLPLVRHSSFQQQTLRQRLLPRNAYRLVGYVYEKDRFLFGNYWDLPTDPVSVNCQQCRAGGGPQLIRLSPAKPPPSGASSPATTTCRSTSPARRRRRNRSRPTSSSGIPDALARQSKGDG